MKPRRLKREWLTFVDESENRAFLQVQCECGELCDAHVEIDKSKSKRKPDSEAYVVDVICAECFTKGVVEGTIIVTGAAVHA